MFLMASVTRGEGRVSLFSSMRSAVLFFITPVVGHIPWFDGGPKSERFCFTVARLKALLLFCGF